MMDDYVLDYNGKVHPLGVSGDLIVDRLYNPTWYGNEEYQWWNDGPNPFNIDIVAYSFKGGYDGKSPVFKTTISVSTLEAEKTILEFDSAYADRKNALAEGVQAAEAAIMEIDGPVLDMCNVDRQAALRGANEFVFRITYPVSGALAKLPEYGALNWTDNLTEEARRYRAESAAIRQAVARGRIAELVREEYEPDEEDEDDIFYQIFGPGPRPRIGSRWPE